MQIQTVTYIQKHCSEYLKMLQIKVNGVMRGHEPVVTSQRK